MVTVVDAANFLEDLRIGKDLQEHRPGRNGRRQPRTVADLLTEQVEFANVVVLNKTDLIDEDTLATMEWLYRTIEPSRTQAACVVWSTSSQRKIMGTGRFDFEIAKQSKGWQLTLRGDGASEVEEYGVSSFVYRVQASISSAAFLRSSQPRLGWRVEK